MVQLYVPPGPEQRFKELAAAPLLARLGHAETETLAQAVAGAMDPSGDGAFGDADRAV